VNLIVAHNIIGGLDFFVKWSSVNHLRNEQINPYSSQAFQLVSEKAEDTIYLPLSGNNSFNAPIYSLFIYYPFSVIHNFEIARALWMTGLCILLVLSLRRQGILSNIVKDKKIETFLVIFILTNIFSLISILSGELIIISFSLILLAFQQFQKGNYELAGIFCGLATLNPGLALFCMAVLSILSLRDGKGGFIIWFLITTGLLVFSGFLILDNWSIQYLQSIVRLLKNILSDLNLGLENPSQVVKIVLPLLFLLIEWIRSFNGIDQPDKINWLFNFTLVLFALSFGSLVPHLYILFIPAWFQVFSEWEKRDNSNAKTIGFINLSIYLGLTVIMLFLDSGILVKQSQFPEILFWFTGFHLVLNMYWIRGWLYQDTMRNFIKTE
jgi:hypothetical protein